MSRGEWDPSRADFPWTEDSIEDVGFRDRFLKLPGIIEDWVRPYRSLRDATVLDFGCGEGVTALGITLKHGPRRLIGVDIMPDPERCPERAREHLGLDALPNAMSLHRIAPGQLVEEARDLDLIYAWSTFEHVDQRILGEILRQLIDRLRPGGLFFVQIAPLYYSAEGSHLCHKIPEPWGHLWMQADLYEERLRQACSDEDEYRSLLSTYRTLNRITAPELVDAIRKAGFEILREHTTCDPTPPPPHVQAAYNHSIACTNQVVVLARR